MLTLPRHPLQSAPIIQDGPVTLAESSAIVDYILATYGQGKLAPGPDQANFADYLFYFHFANSSFQPSILQNGLINRFSLPDGNPSIRFAKTAFEKALRILDERLKKSTWLAGEEFTAADIMNVFSLTTVRLFIPYSYEGYDAIGPWLQRVVERPAYKRAMEKGDPGYVPPIGPAKQTSPAQL